MATYEQLMDGARRADAAGDEAAARRFLELAAEASRAAAPAPAAPQVPAEDFRGTGGGRGTSLEAFLIGARQGATFGFGDEFNAGVRAAGDWVGNPFKIGDGQDFGAAYEERLRHERGLLEQTREENPISSTAGEITGAILPAATYAGPMMAGRGLAGQMAVGGGMGATEGALYGFGEGEGGFANRAESGALTAAISGPLGAVAPLAVPAARQVYLGGKDILGGGADAMLGRASASRANRALASTLEKSGSTVDDVARALASAADDGQTEFKLADALGVSGQRRLSGITRAGGDASSMVADALNARQLDQGDRVGAYVRDAFGFNGRPSGPAQGSALVPDDFRFQDAPGDVLRRPQATAQRAQSALKEARGAVADQAYDAARKAAGPVDVRGALSGINQRLSQLEGSGIKGDEIDQALASFRARLTAPKAALGPGETARDLSDFDRVLGVKQDLQDLIGTASRAGKGNKVRELKVIEKELDAALEASSAPYRKANDQFREASRVIDAVDAGADMARPGMRAPDNVAAFSRLTPDQQQAARLGYGDKALAKVESAAGPGTNRARPFTSTKAQQEADAMAIDPGLFSRRIDRENVMFETRNRAMGGSRTADNLEDIADLKGFDPSIIPQALTAPRQAIVNLLSRSSQTLGGMGPNTRKIVADALLARDADALRAAVKQASTTRERMAIAQALLRLSGASSGGYGLADGVGGPR